MDALQIGEGSVVADLGAGGGWFTVRLARRVGPNGRVYAEDIQPQMIERDRAARATRGADVTSRRVLGTQVDPDLPLGSLDAVADGGRVPRDGAAGRAAPEPRAGRSSRTGTIGIVNYKKDGGGPGPPMEERVDPEKVIRDARAAGLELRKRENFLRYQYMLDASASRRNERGPCFLCRLPGTRQRRAAARWCRGPASAVERAMAYTALAPSKQVRAVLVLLCAELCSGNAARPSGRGGDRAGARGIADPRRPAGDGRRAAAGAAGARITWSSARRSPSSPRSGCSTSPTARSRAATSPPLAARMSSLLVDAVGPTGLIGGQALDLQATDQQISFETLERIHRGKTGALFVAAAAVRRGDRRRGRRADRGAVRLREEPRARVPDRGRSARRRRRSGGDGQGGPRRRPQDDVRVVQRRGRRAPARRGAVRHGGSRARAVRREADRLRELSAFVAARRHRDAS